MRPVRKASNEVFICDTCGLRRRLESAKRHWCDNCVQGTPVEMRPAKDKRAKLSVAA